MRFPLSHRFRVDFHGSLFWLALAWSVITAYNLFKPFHIDDTAHLEIARWIAGHPLRPMSGLLNWSGIEEPIYRTNQPHLYFYLMAAWGEIFGYSELAMHALQSIFAAICILIFYKIACKLAPMQATWLTVIFAIGPAFVVEQNMMVDVPLCAAWLAFFAVLICKIESKKQARRYANLGLFCSVAILIKYSSVVLFVILFISLIVERRGAQWWALLIPLSIIALWSTFNFADYGRVHIIDRSAGGHGAIRTLGFGVSWIVAVGAVSPISVIAVVGRWREGAHWIIAALCASLVACVLAVATGLVPDGVSDKILWVTFLGSGFIAFGLCGAIVLQGESWSRAFEQDSDRITELYLLLWIIGTTSFYVLFAPFIAVRHVLLILPALSFLFAMKWPRLLTTSSKFAALLLTIVISTGLCVSDWRFANFYRSEASRVATAVRTPGKLWVAGHWGWQWYARKNGLSEVDAVSSDVRLGDIIAVADADPQALTQHVSLRPIQTDIDDMPLLNIFCTGGTARFYSFSWHQVPWSINRMCSYRVTIYSVVAP